MCFFSSPIIDKTNVPLALFRRILIDHACISRSIIDASVRPVRKVKLTIAHTAYRQKLFGLRLHFGQAFEEKNLKVQFWARFETEIMDLFGVSSEPFSIHFTVEREFPERGIVFLGRHRRPFAEIMVFERAP